jgi:hypothetical protein
MEITEEVTIICPHCGKEITQEVTIEVEPEDFRQDRD